MRRILAIGLIAVFAGSCTQPKDLEFIDVQNIRMIKWGLSESLIGLDARFYNPNNQSIQLKDPVAKVYANSTYLGETQMDSTIGIPRKDTFAVPLVMKVQTATAISKIMETLSDSSIAIRVEGNVKMGKAGVFLNYPIRYERLQKISDIKF